MSKDKSQSGMGHILLLGAVVVIAVAAFAAWKVMDSNKKDSSLSTTSTQAAAEAPITSGEGLNTASSSLDQASLDNDLDSAALDSDVNSLL